MSSPLHVSFDNKQFLVAFQKFPKEGMTAAGYALNDALKVGQADYRRRMTARFTYRKASGRQFMERQIKMAFFKKGQPGQASIFMQGPNASPGHEILSKHEKGQRTDKEGGMLTVPIRARQHQGTVVPYRLRIKQLGLKPGPGGLLFSTTQKGVFADKKNIYRAVNMHRKDRSKARVDVLYTFRRSTPNPKGPLGWYESAQVAQNAWPRIAAIAVMQKAAHLMNKGVATESDFGSTSGEEG